MNYYNITELPGGIRVVSENIPYVKSFSLGFWFNVGARDENKFNNGISHFIEHMVFKGTKKRSARRISEDVEAFGGYLNAFTGKENTCFYGRGMSQHLNRTFDVISDMIQNPLFRKTHIKKESGVVIDELLDINDNPEELIFDKFEEILFAGNNLSFPIIGTENNIRNFDESVLHEFHKEEYNTSNLLISASGSVDHNMIIRLAEKSLKNNSAKTRNKKRKLLLNNSPNEFVIEKEIQQVHSIIGRTAVGYNNDKRMTLKILSNLLGEGSSSRLFQAVREKLGITYQINTFLNSYKDVSAFGVYFSTNEKQVDKVIGIILKEFKKLREKKITEKELNRVKEFMKGSTLLSLESTTNRMIRIANSVLYFNKIITPEELLDRIDSVTVNDILNISNEYLKEEELTKIFVRSPLKKIKKVA